jgi:hypothetical protein
LDLNPFFGRIQIMLYYGLRCGVRLVRIRILQFTSILSYVSTSGLCHHTKIILHVWLLNTWIWIRNWIRISINLKCWIRILIETDQDPDPHCNQCGSTTPVFCQFYGILFRIRNEKIGSRRAKSVRFCPDPDPEHSRFRTAKL